MNKTCQLVGHRGYPECYPENSLAGCLAAAENGASGIELDIQMSKDGVPILLHDADFNRMTNGAVQSAAADLNYSEMSNISVHEPSRFFDQHYPTPVISLEAFSLAFKHQFKEITFYIEIKKESYKAFAPDLIADAVIKASEALGDRRVYISFDAEVLHYIKQQYQKPVGYVLKKYDLAHLKNYQVLKPNYLICNHKKIACKEVLWRIDCPWFLYDITDPSVYEYWADAGVEYIETWDISSLKLTQTV